MPSMDQRVRRVFREVFDNDRLEIWDGMTPRDLPEWDSLAHVRLVIGLEEEFGVRLMTHDVAHLSSVSELKQALLRAGGSG